MNALWWLVLATLAVVAGGGMARAGDCPPVDAQPWPWRSRAEGLWGEDPALPDDVGLYAQERRAPKMPDAGRRLHALPSRRASVIDDGTLICEVELYSRDGSRPVLYRYKMAAPPKSRPTCPGDWDTFAGPDALLRFRFRDEYPISLFGPEDHWGFFVSVPRVALRSGDDVALRIWDRDAGTWLTGAKPDSRRNDYMGEARLVFDGKLPMVFRSDYFLARCNVMERRQAEAQARPFLQRLGRELAAAEGWRPDANRYDFGEGLMLSTRDDSLRDAAGFVGWSDARIVDGLSRARAAAVTRADRRRELAQALASQARPIVAGAVVETDKGALRVGAVECAGDACTLALEVPAALRRALCERASFRLAVIVGDGRFVSAKLDECAATTGPLHAHLPRAPLVWIARSRSAAESWALPR